MKTRKLFLSAMLVTVVAAVDFGSAGASAATLVHVYELEGDFLDSLGGPALVPNGGTLGVNRYTFGANQGLSLTNGLVDTSDYSIVVVFEFDSLSPTWKKVIDFQQLSEDFGVYIEDDALSFFTLFSSPGGPDMVTANTDSQIVLTRDSATQTVSGYLNGVLQWTSADPTGQAVSISNVLNFFEDDFDDLEAQSGSVDSIAIHDGALSADEVGFLFADGFESGDTSAWSKTVP